MTRTLQHRPIRLALALLAALALTAVCGVPPASGDGHEDPFPPLDCNPYLPELRFDDEEVWPAGDVESSLRSGTTLRRADGQEVIPQSGHQVNVDYLDSFNYADGQPAYLDDVMGLPSIPQPGGRPTVYCRWATSQSGQEPSCGWWQYWIWYHYNPALPGTSGQGAHEGDWEMVQTQLCSAEPVQVAYSQHGRAATCPWSQVEGTDFRSGHPVVYVALNGHASYFRPGRYSPNTGPPEISGQDRADGDGEEVLPAFNAIEQYGGMQPWVRYTGTWGATESDGSIGAQSSPKGPFMHSLEWDEPGQWAAQGGGIGC